MAKDAYYFSHDANARNDTKVLAMRCDYGLEGYGMYWILIEILREQDGYKLKHDKSTYRALAMQMHSTVDAVKKFINDCINEYGLLQSDTTYFWSESLLRRMKKLEDIREKRRKAAEKRWARVDEKEKESNNNANAEQNNAKKSKVKENKNNIYTCEFEEFWSHYPRKKEKKKAFTKWKARLKEGYKPEDLIKAAINYANECKKKETEERYIKHGATFLGPDKPFEDYIKQSEVKLDEKVITLPSFRPAEEVLKGRDLSELIDESLLRGTS
ncbi:DUF4373 domain-containing protein [Caminicella sporogenes]|uniref:DUF4373 domain-containing protein n=1 Tax=Caminicella sporogenes TaxID=166485 RepID=UPI0025422555|nr:DUF4373 domain-containing protein [Caminicella sporogenes]WIF95044.1 DUF4373 domain-containing protein [Caminicella sporogenes]